jgi:hypothetical protein
MGRELVDIWNIFLLDFFALSTLTIMFTKELNYVQNCLFSLFLFSKNGFW